MPDTSYDRDLRQRLAELEDNNDNRSVEIFKAEVLLCISEELSSIRFELELIRERFQTLR